MNDRKLPEDPNRDERIIEQLAIHLHNVWLEHMELSSWLLGILAERDGVAWRAVAEAALRDIHHADRSG